MGTFVMRSVLACAMVLLALDSRLTAAELKHGDIVVCDVSAEALFRIDPLTGASSVIASGGHLYMARGMAFDASGRIVVVNDWSGSGQHGNLVRVDPSSGAQTLLFYGAGGDDPAHPVVLPNGDILFTDYGSGTGRLRRLHPGTGNVTNVWSGAPFGAVLNMARVGDTLYIVDRAGFAVPTHSGIRTFKLGSNEHGILTSGGNFVSPLGIVRDPLTGDLYVADSQATPSLRGAIIRVNANTGAQTIVSSGGLFVDPVDLAFDPSGNLIVVDQRGSGPSLVISVNPATGAQTLLTPNGFGQNALGVLVYAIPEPAHAGCLLVVSTLVLRRGGRSRRGPTAPIRRSDFAHQS